MDSHDNQFGMDGTGFWETIPALQNNFSGGSSEGTTMSKGGRRKGSKDGSNRDDNGGIGHYNALTEDENIYLTDLFFNKLKASGGIHYLYNHMKQDGGTVSWRKVVAFHKSFIVNQKSRPAKKQTKSLAVMPNRKDLVPMRHIGCDFIIMQAEQGLAEAQYSLGKMYHQGEGVQQDFKQAAAWCQRAAEQGHTRAYLMLGMLSENAGDYQAAFESYRAGQAASRDGARTGMRRCLEQMAESRQKKQDATHATK